MSQGPESENPEEEGSILDPDSPMFAAFAKLAKDKPNSPAVQSVREALDNLLPDLDQLATNLEDAVLRMDPDPETEVEIMRGKLKRAMGRTLSGKRKEFIEMSYRLAHAFEPYSEEAKKQKEAPKLKLMEDSRVLGRDWYRFRLRGSFPGVSLDILRNRYTDMASTSVLFSNDEHPSSWEAFVKGFEINEKRLTREQSNLIDKLESGSARLVLFGKPRSDFMASIVRNGLGDLCSLFFTVAIGDMESEENLDSLKSFVGADENKQRLLGQSGRVEIGNLLPAFNDWFVHHRLS